MSFVLPGIVESARVATQSNVDLSTLDSGTVVDGIVLAESDRIFVKSQTDPISNGIYEIQTTGQAYRAYDAETGRSFGGLTVTVREGTVDGDSRFVCTNDAPNDIIGTHGLVFVQTSGIGVDGNVNSTESSSIDNQIVLFDGTSGTEIKKSTVTIDSNNNVGSIGYLEFAEIVSPSNPVDNSGRLYKKAGDDGLWWKPDSGGPEVDLTIVGNTGSFGNEYEYSESTTELSTSSTTYSLAHQLTTSSLPSGTYKISWYYNWRATGTTGRDFRAQILIDDTTEISEHREESKDVNNDQLKIGSGFIETSLSAGSHTIKIYFASSSPIMDAYISNKRIEIYRIL